MKRSVLSIIGLIALGLACNSEHTMQSNDVKSKEKGVKQLSSDNQVVSQEDSITATEEDLGSVACLTDNQIIKAGESLDFSWEFSSIDDLSFEVTINYDGESDIGSIQYNEEQKTATYTAPVSIPEELKLSVKGRLSSGVAADCSLTLMADGDLGVEDDGKVSGLVGKIYQLDADTRSLPDFSQMQEIATIVSKDVNVAARRFDTGFPGLANLFEWFGIAYKGKIEIKEAGNYTFRLHSDDGSKLYINQELIIDNDGTHGPRSIDGSIFLEAGKHEIAIDYFQGPRFQIALQFFWSPADDGQFEIVPADLLSR